MAGRTPKRVAVRRKRIGAMAKELVDVEGAAELLGVSVWTIYQLARKGTIPGTRVGKEWRFARASLIQWVANGAQADQLKTLLSKARPARRR
jgi:excisionase family DNA binding protein